MKKFNLTKEKEIELGKIIRESSNAQEVEEAVRTLVEANLGLVIGIARDYHSTELSFDDRVQEGNIGLWEAARTFDYSKGNKFSSYATPVIKRKIIDALRRIKIIQLKTSSFDTPIDEEDKRSLHDVIEDESNVSPLDKIIQREENKKLLGKLKVEERRVLQEKLGMTYKEIGQELGKTPERARQINRKALRKSRFVSIEETAKKLQDKAIGIDYHKEIEPILISTGIICDKEMRVEEKVSDEGIRETIRKIEEEEEKQLKGLTEEQSEVVKKTFKDTKDAVLIPWEWMKKLKIRGNRIVYPDKTKPRREDVFQAVTVMVALFEEKTGSPHWDLIEEILYPYYKQVFKGGNIESWYYKNEKKALKVLSPPPFIAEKMTSQSSLISREERKKFILSSFRNTGTYSIGIPPDNSLCSPQEPSEN
jgi:RNA polymerase primary sigma factor